MLAESGSHWIRVGVGWRSAETSPGVYSSTKLAFYDGIMARARAAGQRVQFNIVDTPGRRTAARRQRPADRPEGDRAVPTLHDRPLLGARQWRRSRSGTSTTLSRF
jgi:hypothetical protein